MHRSLRLSQMIPKFAISALPLPAQSLLLTQQLTVDPNTTDFKTSLKSKPSIQRRSRLLQPQSHFSLVSPFPHPFPYDIQPPEDGDPVEDKSQYIEKWLADREAVHEEGPASENGLKKYVARNRDQRQILIGLSETGLRDCLPHLEIGDALTLLGSPSLLPAAIDEAEPTPSPSEQHRLVREELINVLSGATMLMSDTFAPWSLRYSGHQFGTWAGQLGDGRAVSILVTPHPSDPELTYELQLKGAGRTPFSRSADGLAVLRSSVREYLCSEAMHGLSIPTTRSLSLISLPDLPVAREKMETACIMTRMAPSFLRIGSFEAFNPPSNVFVFGGGQQKAHWDGLRILGEWVSRHVLKLGLAHDEPWGKALILEVARRNARMVAGWQAYGFMHGVINTDNVSILGLTIDYGPYAFMDVFDPFHICNHTDESGRYAYRYQPNMIIYALRALLNSLAPLIGAEAEHGKTVSAGWGDDVSTEKLDEWRKKGLELVQDDLEKEAQELMSVEYGRLLRKRLALRRQEPTDETNFSRPLLDIMAEQKLDFHITFRTLTRFKPSLLEDDSGLQALITDLLNNSADESLDHTSATKSWMTWLEKYASRIDSEKAEWKSEAEREGAARGANPRFVLRQWVLEEVIAKFDHDVETGKRVLAKVLHMACNPFEAWGGEDSEEEDMDAEEKEERRFCGPGAKQMLGFQCSCSS
ncbi:hypothetical protein C8J56DRAFT_1013273 [Mycena floridula]|nr:hypothetical protein C8J56DRAFT_1013273 [Mycena floridula]